MITLTTLTISEKYLVPGQPITSSNLNKHVSKIFSNRNNYIARRFDITLENNILTIMPGACIINYTLISVDSVIQIELPQLEGNTLYHIIISYENPCYNTFPKLELATNNELNNYTNYVILASIINNNIINSYTTETNNIRLLHLPVSVYLDTFSNKFSLDSILDFGDVITDVFVNGTKLVKDIDYIIDNNNIVLTCDSTSQETKTWALDVLKIQHANNNIIFESQLYDAKIIDLVDNNYTIDSIPLDFSNEITGYTISEEINYSLHNFSIQDYTSLNKVLTLIDKNTAVIGVKISNSESYLKFINLLTKNTVGTSDNINNYAAYLFDHVCVFGDNKLFLISIESEDFQIWTLNTRIVDFQDMNNITVSQAIVAIQLEENYPYIILDAKYKNGNFYVAVATHAYYEHGVIYKYDLTNNIQYNNNLSNIVLDDSTILNIWTAAEIIVGENNVAVIIQKSPTHTYSRLLLLDNSLVYTKINVTLTDQGISHSNLSDIKVLFPLTNNYNSGKNRVSSTDLSIFTPSPSAKDFLSSIETNIPLEKCFFNAVEKDYNNRTYLCSYTCFIDGNISGVQIQKIVDSYPFSDFIEIGYYNSALKPVSNSTNVLVEVESSDYNFVHVSLIPQHERYEKINIEIFRNNEYLHNIGNNDYNIIDKTLYINPPLIETDNISIMIFKENSVFSSFVSNSYFKYILHANTATQFVDVITQSKVKSVVAFVNGKFVGPLDFLYVFSNNMYINSIEVNLQPNDICTLILTKDSDENSIGDTTEYIVNVTNNNEIEDIIIYVPSEKVKYGHVLVFVNGCILPKYNKHNYNDNLYYLMYYSYDHELGCITVYNCEPQSRVIICLR